MRLRRLAPVTAAALMPMLLASCSGDDAQDNPPVGVVRSDRMNVLNATLVTDGESVGTLVATLVNEATKLAGASGTKGSFDESVADDLLAKIDKIAEIFAETKKA